MDEEDSPGGSTWRNMPLVLETYAGIATAMMEAQRAYNEATEVPSTVVLKDFPTEEEQLEYFMKKYGLRRSETGTAYDAATQIGRPRRQVGTQTTPELSSRGSQTVNTHGPETPPCLAEATRPFPLVPFSSAETQTPWKIQVHPFPDNPHFRSQPDYPAPILGENFVKGFRSEDSGSSERVEIPSLLDLKVEKPAKVNLRTLKYLEETLRSGCWNCGDGGHCFSECKSRLRVFCFACGEPGFIKRTCPYCKNRK